MSIEIVIALCLALITGTLIGHIITLRTQHRRPKPEASTSTPSTEKQSQGQNVLDLGPPELKLLWAHAQMCGAEFFIGPDMENIYSFHWPSSITHVELLVSEPLGPISEGNYLVCRIWPGMGDLEVHRIYQAISQINAAIEHAAQMLHTQGRLPFIRATSRPTGTLQLLYIDVSSGGHGLDRLDFTYIETIRRRAANLQKSHHQSAA